MPFFHFLVYLFNGKHLRQKHRPVTCFYLSVLIIQLFWTKWVFAINIALIFVLIAELRQPLTLFKIILKQFPHAVKNNTAKPVSYWFTVLAALNVIKDKLSECSFI